MKKRKRKVGMTRKARAYISKIMRKEIGAGTPPRRAAAIAYSKARKRGFRIPTRKYFENPDEGLTAAKMNHLPSNRRIHPDNNTSEKLAVQTIKGNPSRTLKLKQDLWLFSDQPNDQTHIIKRAGEKVKLFWTPGTGFGSVYERHYTGRMLSATLNRDDIRNYFGVAMEKENPGFAEGLAMAGNITGIASSLKNLLYKKNPRKIMKRFRAEKSRHLPKGSVNVAHVYDFQTGQIARKEDGALAYFHTFAEAKQFADINNEKSNPVTPLEWAKGAMSIHLLSAGNQATWAPRLSPKNFRAAIKILKQHAKADPEAARLLADATMKKNPSSLQWQKVDVVGNDGMIEFADTQFGRFKIIKDPIGKRYDLYGPGDRYLASAMAPARIKKFAASAYWSLKKEGTMKKNPSRTEADRVYASEIYAAATSLLPEQQQEAFARNMISKMARGTYDRAKGVKLFSYMAKRAWEEYKKEYGVSTFHGLGATLMEAGRKLEADFYERAQAGEFEHLKPKKYRKNPHRKGICKYCGLSKKDHPPTRYVGECSEKAYQEKYRKDYRKNVGGLIRENAGKDVSTSDAFDAGKHYRLSGAADRSGVANARVVKYGFIKWLNEFPPGAGSGKKGRLAKAFREGYAAGKRVEKRASGGVFRYDESGKHYVKKNPPVKGRELIYGKLLEIRATQNQSDGVSRRDRFVHKFSKPAKVYGNPDGSITIKGKQRLWKRFK